MTSPNRSSGPDTAGTSWSVAPAEPGPKAMTEFACTPGQTVGPFFSLALTYRGDGDLVGDAHPRAGWLRRDPMVFTGWGRSATDDAGRYGFTTVAPASAAAGRPPFFAIAVFARGLLNRLFTRAYVPCADPNADPLLAAVDAGRRDTLVCVSESGGVAY